MAQGKVVKSEAKKAEEPEKPEKPTKTAEMLDLAIIGAGPAALSAALYAARAGLTVKVFERQNYGGELSLIPEITNYPGYRGAGADLAAAMRRQAAQAGAQFAYGECERVQQTATGLRLKVDGASVPACRVLVATGATPKPLPFSLAVPVSYCALCDGELAKSQHVAVVGGANSAVQEALYLAPLVKDLTLVTHSALKADPYLTEQLRQQANVTILEKVEPTAAMLNKFQRVFVAIGRVPATQCLRRLKKERLARKRIKLGPVELLDFELERELGLLDRQGYVVTGGRKRSPHETTLSGLFAAGDVRAGVEKQVVVAAGDGAAAAIEIVRSLQKSPQK